VFSPCRLCEITARRWLSVIEEMDPHRNGISQHLDLEFSSLQIYEK
jgi:hypothetical protein